MRPATARLNPPCLFPSPFSLIHLTRASLSFSCPLPLLILPPSFLLLCASLEEEEEKKKSCFLIQLTPGTDRPIPKSKRDALPTLLLLYYYDYYSFSTIQNVDSTISRVEIFGWKCCLSSGWGCGGGGEKNRPSPTTATIVVKWRYYVDCTHNHQVAAAAAWSNLFLIPPIPDSWVEHLYKIVFFSIWLIRKCIKKLMLLLCAVRWISYKFYCKSLWSLDVTVDWVGLVGVSTRRNVPRVSTILTWVGQQTNVCPSHVPFFFFLDWFARRSRGHTLPPTSALLPASHVSLLLSTAMRCAALCIALRGDSRPRERRRRRHSAIRHAWQPMNERVNPVVFSKDKKKKKILSFSTSVVCVCVLSDFSHLFSRFPFPYVCARPPSLFLLLLLVSAHSCKDPSHPPPSSQRSGKTRIKKTGKILRGRNCKILGKRMWATAITRTNARHGTPCTATSSRRDFLLCLPVKLWLNAPLAKKKISMYIFKKLKKKNWPRPWKSTATTTILMMRKSWNQVVVLFHLLLLLLWTSSFLHVKNVAALTLSRAAPLPVIYEDSPLFTLLLSSSLVELCCCYSFDSIDENLRLLSTKHGRIKQNVLHEKKGERRRRRRRWWRGDLSARN